MLRFVLLAVLAVLVWRGAPVEESKELLWTTSPGFRRPRSSRRGTGPAGKNRTT